MERQNEKITKHFISLTIIVCIGLFVITSVMGLYYVYSIKRESAYNVTKVVEGMLKSHQYREAVYSLSNAKLGSFSAIGYYDFEGNRVFVLPPTLGPDYFEEEKGLISNLTTTNIPVDIFFDENSQDRAGTIIYTYHHGSAAKAVLLFCVVGFMFLLPVIFKYKSLIRRSIDRDLLAEKNKGIKEIVRQVWHDLNQPMQLLYALAENENSMGDRTRDKVKSACDDMASILDDLKYKRDRFAPSEVSSTCLAASVKETVEKESLKISSKQQSVVFSTCEEGLMAFSDINESEFKRILGNLIDNASLASPNGGKIYVKLLKEDNQNIVKINDQGQGIKPEHLAMIGKRGVSFREGGNGIGLSYAIEKVESWEGKLKIDSEFGKGTNVRISLPEVKPPKWYNGRLPIQSINEFVLTDDRPVIHTLVKERLDHIRPNLEKHFHLSSDQFSNWYSNHKDKLKSPIFVFDFDMGDQAQTGLDLIHEFRLEGRAVLMTNYHDDSLVQAKAENANVKIFPKNLIEFMGA